MKEMLTESFSKYYKVTFTTYYKALQSCKVDYYITCCEEVYSGEMDKILRPLDYKPMENSTTKLTNKTPIRVELAGHYRIVDVLELE